MNRATKEEDRVVITQEYPLKAIVYAYVSKVYSSRRIEQMMRENLIMMWLYSMQVIDHNTINNFRKGVLKQHIDHVFAQVPLLLIEKGGIKLEKLHTDGTKIEANANRYTFVWAKVSAPIKANY